MKKFLIALLFLIFFVPFAFADRNTSTITAYQWSRNLIKAGDWKVYKITITAITASGSFAIYDSLTYPTDNGLSSVKAEGQEATAKNGKIYDYTAKPIEGSTGLYLDTNGATIIVEYE